MKCTLRLTALFLALVLLALTLSSCGASDPAKDFSNEYNPETDFQYALEYDDLGLSYMTESPDGYYFLNENFLYFIDKNTMDVMPLCKKPNCLHDNLDTSHGNVPCEAYIGMSNYDAGLFYYDNAIYVLTCENADGKYRSQNILQKRSLDGTILEAFYTFPKSPQAIIRHRDKVYYTYQDIVTTGGGNINSTFKLMSVSLKDKTETEVLVDPLADGMMDKLFAYGKYVYIYNYGSDPDFDINDPAGFVYQLLIYDTETGKVSVMETPEIEATLDVPSLCKNGLSFNLWDYDDTSNLNLYYYKTGLDGKNPEDFFCSSVSVCKLRWDGTYYYEDNRPAVYISKTESTRKINVYNDTLELVGTITFDKVDNNPGNVDFSATANKVICATEDYLFFKDGYSSMTLLAVDKKQIGTGNITPFIVWKNW